KIQNSSNLGEHKNFHLIDLSEESFECAKAIEALQIPCTAYVCVMTHDHALDRALIEELGDRPVAYLGMIGSDRKVAISNKYFLENNLLTKEEIKRIHQPIGLNIGAETPEEIAISVLAQLIDIRASFRKQQKHSGEMATKITNKMLGSVSISRNYE
ncbi:MAG: xanthine/CO dehydrogenase XdhC/CoxF family maturation factor, partial [Limisphaerales bacterium]